MVTVVVVKPSWCVSGDQDLEPENSECRADDQLVEAGIPKSFNQGPFFPDRQCSSNDCLGVWGKYHDTWRCLLAYCNLRQNLPICRFCNLGLDAIDVLHRLATSQHCTSAKELWRFRNCTTPIEIY